MSGFAILVYFVVRDGASDAFLRLVKDNARASVADEPGCRRFDVLVPDGRPNEVTLYEIYDDRAAFGAHLATAHFKRFDDATAEMVESKRVTELSVHFDSDPAA